MKRQRILTACILAAMAIIFVVPTHLLAEQEIGGSPNNGRAIEQEGNNSVTPNGIPVNYTAYLQDEYFFPDGVTPLDFISLPDWRGGDRVVWPILIKIFIKHKLSTIRELSK
jgi:hypothetical protein